MLKNSFSRRNEILVKHRGTKLLVLQIAKGEILR